MIVAKDVYEYLLSFVDDKTVINMLSVNKKFRDEKLFERVMKRRYPLLIESKNFEKESWKMYFVRMSYYITKLQNKHSIPYIPTKRYNPQFFYMQWKNKKQFHKYGFHLIYPGEIYDCAIKWAVAGGCSDIVNLLFEKGSSLSSNIDIAIREGQTNIVKLLLEKGVKASDEDMFNAIMREQIDIVKLLLERGAKTFREVTEVMLKQGYTDIIKFMKEKGIEDFRKDLRLLATFNMLQED